MATVERLNLPQRTGSAQGCFVMPRTWASRRGSAPGESEASLPEWINYPLDTKMPMIPGIEKAMVLYTTNLGERLHARPDDHDFDLTDPCGHQLSTEYNLLHDPHLKPFYSSPHVKRRLIRNGFITEDGKVLCTLKEFNQYRQYLRKISLDYYRNERRRQLEEALLTQERTEQKKKEDKAQSESLQIIRSRREKAKQTRQKLQEQEEAARRRYMKMMRKDSVKRNLVQMEKTIKQEHDHKRKEEEWEQKKFKSQLKQDRERRRRKKVMETWKSDEKDRQRRMDERRRQELREKEEKRMEHFVEHARLRAIQREEMLRLEEEERVRRQENIRAREAAIQAQRQKQYEIFMKRKQRQQEGRERTQKAMLSMWLQKSKSGQAKEEAGKEAPPSGNKAGLFSRFMGMTNGAQSKKEENSSGSSLARLVDRAIDKAITDYESSQSLAQVEQIDEPKLSFVDEPVASKKQVKPTTRRDVTRKRGRKGRQKSFKFKVSKNSIRRLKSEFHGAKMVDVDEMERQEEEKAELLIMQLQTDFPGADVSLAQEEEEGEEEEDEEEEEEEDEEEEEVVEEVELEQVLSRSDTTLLHVRAAEIVRAVMETVSKVIIPRMVSEDKFTVTPRQSESETSVMRQTAGEFVPWVVAGVQRELRTSVTPKPSRSDTHVLSRVASEMVTSVLGRLKTEMSEEVADGSADEVSQVASELVSFVIEGVEKEFSKEVVETDRKVEVTKSVTKSVSEGSLFTKTARDLVAYVIDGVTKELTGHRSDVSAGVPTKSRSDTSLISLTASAVVSSVIDVAKTPSKVRRSVSESDSVREMATQITSWVIERVRQEMADGSSEASAESFDDSALERELLRTMRADSTPVEEPYSRPLSPEPSSDVEIARAVSKQSTASKQEPHRQTVVSPKSSKTQSRKPSTSKVASRKVSKETVSSKTSSEAVPLMSSSSHKVRLLARVSRSSVKASPVPSKADVAPSPTTSKTAVTPTKKLSRTSRESVTTVSKKSKSDSAVQRTSKEQIQAAVSKSQSSNTISSSASKAFQQRSQEGFKPSPKASSQSVRRSSKMSLKKEPSTKTSSAHVLPASYEASTGDGKLSNKSSEEKTAGDSKSSSVMLNVRTETSTTAAAEPVVQPKEKSSLERTEASSERTTSTTDSSDAPTTDKPAKVASKEGVASPKKSVSAKQVSSGGEKSLVKKTSSRVAHAFSSPSSKSSPSVERQPSKRTKSGMEQTSDHSKSSGRRTSISAHGLDVRRSSSRTMAGATSLDRKSSGGVVVRSGPSLSGEAVEEKQEDKDELETSESETRVVKTAPTTPLPEDDVQPDGDAVMPSSMSEGSVKAKKSVSKVGSTQSAWSATPSRNALSGATTPLTKSSTMLKKRTSSKTLTSKQESFTEARSTPSKSSSQFSRLPENRTSQSSMTSPSVTKVSASKSVSKDKSQLKIVASQSRPMLSKSSSRTPSLEKPPSKSSVQASPSKSTSKLRTSASSSSGSGGLRKNQSGTVAKSSTTLASKTKSDQSVPRAASKSTASKSTSVLSSQRSKTSATATHDVKRSSSSVRSSKDKSSSAVHTSQSRSKDSIKDTTEISVESNAPKPEEELAQPVDMEGNLDEDLHLDEDEERDFGEDNEEPPAKEMQLLGVETAGTSEISDVSDIEDEEVLTETENVVIKKRRESLVGAVPAEEIKSVSGSRASMKSYRRHSIASSCVTMELDKSDKSESVPLAPTLQGRTVALDDDLRENLSAISVKASFQDKMQDEVTPRNSFRCLQRPELSSTVGLEREESLRSLITKRRMSMPSDATLASFRGEISSEDVVQVNTMFDVGEFSRGVRRYSEVPKKPIVTYRPQVDSSASLERVEESKEDKS